MDGQPFLTVRRMKTPPESGRTYFQWALHVHMGERDREQLLVAAIHGSSLSLTISLSVILDGAAGGDLCAAVWELRRVVLPCTADEY